MHPSTTRFPNSVVSTRRRAEFSLVAARKREETAEDHAEPEGTANTNTGTGCARANTRQAFRRLGHHAAHGRDEEIVAPRRRHRVLPAHARTAPRTSVPCGARKARQILSSHASVAPWRRVTKNSAPSQFRVAAQAWPNPSLKRTHNGIAVWPSSAGASPHFALAVQPAMPL